MGPQRAMSRLFTVLAFPLLCSGRYQPASPTSRPWEQAGRTDVDVAVPPRLNALLHAVWDQLLMLRSRFPDRWQGDVADVDLPLFPKLLSLIHI